MTTGKRPKPKLVKGWTYAQFKRDLLKVVRGKPPAKRDRG